MTVSNSAQMIEFDTLAVDSIERDAYVVIVYNGVIKWKQIPRYWPCVREIHRLPVNSPHRGQWRGALMVFFYLPEQTVEQILETPVIWDAIPLIMTSL